jgi:hypothetical protein
LSAEEWGRKNEKVAATDLPNKGREKVPTHSQTQRRLQEASLSHDHGVTHHGASYQLSKRELELIDQLTFWDGVLYQLAQRIFQEQLEDLQAEFGITICEELRSDIDFSGEPIHAGG